MLMMSEISDTAGRKPNPKRKDIMTTTAIDIATAPARHALALAIMEQDRATSVIVLRVQPGRKAAYVKAAAPGTLSAWALRNLDAAAETSDIDPMDDEQWMIDGRISLTDACRDSRWHRATAIDRLMAQGIGRDDAEAFVAFRFALASKTDWKRAEDHLSDEQYERLRSRKD